jgi:S-adenosylmethionine hydrolase
MKGVVLSINPAVGIVDITHEIDPQDVTLAAYRIKAAYSYFPEGTVHVAVVDPGVGSRRAILAFEMQGHIFLGPDNGLFTRIMAAGNIGKIVRVENVDYFLTPVSRTFHGRDIFAPVAGHLSKGVALENLGPVISRDDLVYLDLPMPNYSDQGVLTGNIIMADRFGNLITNLDAECLEKVCREDQQTDVTVRVGSYTINGLSESYASAGINQPLAIIGSEGYLEISVNGGSAKEYLKTSKGDFVTVERR